MNAAQIAQLAITLAPLLQSLALEGTKTILTYREHVTQEQLDTALGLSKSTDWPSLTFGFDLASGPDYSVKQGQN